MKKTILGSLLFILAVMVYGHNGKYARSDFFEGMGAGDKAAILMVHFGTTHDDTRTKTIDALNRKVKDVFPQMEVREAYTSRIVIKRLGERGIVKENPFVALTKLRKDGYTHILIQPSTVIQGSEQESVMKNANQFRDMFKEIRIGEPLLYTPEDYEEVIDALAAGNNPQTAYVWVGHGTSYVTTAQYAMVDYMLKDKGHSNCFVGTVEGYPTFDNVLRQLKKTAFKKVTLVPFMLVSGEHAQNDIAKEWQERLQKAGYVVSIDMRGLGERAEIRDIYIKHLQFLIDYKAIDILDKKNQYEITGEKAESE